MRYPFLIKEITLQEGLAWRPSAVCRMDARTCASMRGGALGK
ncbi:hypothetical protein [Paraburkholderia steynii]|nr:hypothetical protein [Paraburkholderia steynii]